MNSILQATADLLKSKKFQPAFTEEGDTLVLRCSGKHLFWTTEVDTADNDTTITMLTRVPAKVPPAKRAVCAKLLARLNYGKRQGAFHMDLRDGEVLFCISNVLSAGIASEEAIDSLFCVTYCAMNEAAPEILKLVYGHSQASKTGSTTRFPDPDRNISPPGLNN
jgi:hypothetical protein